MNLLALLLLLTATQEVARVEPSARQSEPARTSQCLDINTASRAELLTWAGLTPVSADTIIKGRPYTRVAQVKERMPKEVWDKNRTKLCLPRVRATNGIQMISGNKIETIQFEAKPNDETKPAVQPAVPPLPTALPTQRLPQETIDERFRELSREATKGAEAPADKSPQ